MAKINSENYELIKSKIQAIKAEIAGFKDAKDDYIFNVLGLRNVFFQNPNWELSEDDIKDMIVDGHGDGGADILLTDPNSETSDLIIGQSKYYKTIDRDDCINAINKMVNFYKDMTEGHYEKVNSSVQQRFLQLFAEVGDESKIKFVLMTSAPKNNIRIDLLKKELYGKLTDQSKFELEVMFDADIIEKIKETESRRPSVAEGKIMIDNENNFLKHQNSLVVNASAFSIKKLYAENSTNLLSRNLRYHIAGTVVDRAIEESINNNPENFWAKNNGITILCEEYEIEGKSIKLKNFSIVNGGQTTYILAKNENIAMGYDFFIMCKIIKIIGNNEDDKSSFSLEVAKATNSQKAIKNSDLKANAPEQLRFSQAMRDVGVYYATKRGEKIPKEYKEKTCHTDISEIGKLALSAIFQMPGSSRNKPSTIYLPGYYNIIFDGNQNQIAMISKELMYIDFYFRKKFINKYNRDNSNNPNAETIIPFANNARTSCTAFVMFASRYSQGYLNNDKINKIFDAVKKDKLTDPEIYQIVKNLDDLKWVLPKKVFDNNIEKYDETLYQLFDLFIKRGAHDLMVLQESKESINASNFLKSDKNYLAIIRNNWDLFKEKTTEIFEEIM